MNYTHSITSKGQITIPLAFRRRLGLDKTGKATLRLNENQEIVITAPKTLADVRRMLVTPSHREPLSEKEVLISKQLMKKYGVR